MKDAIAIVGMGCRLPGAPDLTSLRRQVRSGAVAVRDVPARWDHRAFYDPNPRRLDKSYARRLASVDDIDMFCPEYFGILPRRARFMDPQQRLLLDTARAAIEDAALAPAELAARRVGVFVGISVAEHYQLATAGLGTRLLRTGGYGRVATGLDDALEVATENVPPIQAHTMVGQMLNMAAANVAQAFDLRGPALSTDSACSSALVALGEAILHLRAGSCDAALVGGVYLACTPNNLVAFSRIGALSRAEVCRPFDERADGFVLGEGAGCVLVERLEDAVASGHRIWAVVRGFGSNNDGRGEGPMTPRLDGQVDAIQKAHADAGVSPQEIRLVEAHGTATRVGDLVEANALARVWGEARRGAPASSGYLTSIKGNIGHTLAAAGAAGLMNATFAVAEGVVPPLAGHERRRAELPLGETGFEVPAAAVEWQSSGPRLAAVSSFGFGGTNVHVVLEEPPRPARPRARAAAHANGRRNGVPAAGADAPERLAADEDAPELLLLSAPNAALLARYARALAGELADGVLRLADVAYTLSRRRLDPVRAALVVSSTGEAQRVLERIALALEGDPAGAGDGAWLCLGGEGALGVEQLAFLFPGQGAQAPDLCRDLFDRFPAFRARLEALAGAAEPVLGRSLLPALYPEADQRDRAAAELVRTEVTQPTLAAVELALAGFLGDLGLAPGVFMGHSLGEFVAAAAGGVIEPAEVVRLVAERGRFMAELAGDRGQMAALAADRVAAARLVDGVDAVLANINHGRQAVASGTSTAIDQVMARAKAARVGAIRLAVSHAFHSPVMAPAAARFAARLDEVALSPPRARVISCAAAAGVGPMESEPDAIRTRLAGHAASPIDFEAGLLSAWHEGARGFVQVGAGTALLSMLSATLDAAGERARLAVAAAPNDNQSGVGLLAALGELIAAGIPVTPAALFTGRALELVSLPISPLETRSLWLVRPPPNPAPLPELVTPTKNEELSMSDRPGEPEPARAPIYDLFQRQLEVMQAQLAVLEGRGIEVPAELRSTGHSPPLADSSASSAPGSASPSTSGSAQPSASVSGSESVSGSASASASASGSDPQQIERQLLQLVARVSALPPDSLTPRTRLGADLGLDSLMIVELGAAIQESFRLTEVPAELIGRDASVAELAERLAALLAGGGPQTAAPDRPLLGDPDRALDRHLATWAPRPLLVDPSAGPSFDGSAILHPDPSGLAAAELASRLGAAGRDVLLVDASALADPTAFTWPASAGLFIDLGSLEEVPDAAQVAAPEPFALAAPLRRGLAAAAAAARAGVRPAYLAVASGPAAATAAGFARALAAEWPDRLARAIEAPAGAASAASLAEALWCELCTTDRTPEVRFEAGERRAIALEPAPLPSRSPSLRVTTAVVSGGGRGIGAGVARSLAASGVSNLVLLGRRAPDAEVERTTAAIAAAGGRARYLACDVADPSALGRALAEARAAFGPVQLVVHAAGQTADGPVERALESGAQEAVFGGKVAGALALWRACQHEPLRAFLMIGSWAGRFGNRHQAIYAAANRAMSGMPGALAAERPDVRVVSIDLPPWSGTDMVERLPEAVRATMRARGVPFLDDQRGLPLLLAELDGAPGAAEVVLGAGPDGSGPRDRARVPLDPAAPWLADHRVDGVPRLPLAAALDLALAGAARLGLDPADGPVAITGARVLSAIDVPAAGTTLAIEARARPGGATGASTDASIDLEIWIEPDDPLRGEPRLAVVARAEPASAPLEPVMPAPAGDAPALSLDEFYSAHTFHGPRMRGITHVAETSERHVRGLVVTAPPEWPRAGLDILGLDAALQLAGFFARERLGRAALPVAVAECRVLAPLPPAAELTATAVLERAGDSSLFGHIDLLDASGRPLVQLRGLTAHVIETEARPNRASNGHRSGNGAPPVIRHQENRQVSVRGDPGGAPPVIRHQENRQVSVRGDPGGAPPVIRHQENRQVSVRGDPGGAPPVIRHQENRQVSVRGDPGGAHPVIRHQENRQVSVRGDPGGAHSAYIDPTTYRIAEFPEVAELSQRRAMVEALGLRNPYFHLHERVTNERSTIGGAEFLNYSSYNYLGLSGHPEVNRAVERAIERYGTSVSASRIASGEKPLHRELERALAELLGCEDAIVLVSGHATNVSVIGHMFDQRDVILHDSLAHDSILGGARLSGARRRPFPHNDADALEELLRQIRPQARRVLIAVEGVYSMDGDLAPLERIVEIKKKYGALLLVDEAHSLGVLGRTGRGIGEHAGIDRADVDLWMGTLSKSLASCGGYIAGSTALVDYLKYTNPGFVYSVGISPANAAAALAAVDLMLREPDRVATLQARAGYFLAALRDRGIDTGMSRESAVVPAIVPSSLDCLRLAQALYDRGVNVQPILYPAVEENLARLRFFVTAGHSEADLRFTADAVREELGAINPRHLRAIPTSPPAPLQARVATP